MNSVDCKIISLLHLELDIGLAGGSDGVHQLGGEAEGDLGVVLGVEQQHRALHPGQDQSGVGTVVVT